MATAADLVKQALLTNHTTDLTSQPWWNSQPLAVRQAAFAQLNTLFASPQNIANYVVQNGIQNLQNYAWWNSYANKNQAWNVIQQRQAAAKPVAVSQPTTAQPTVETPLKNQTPAQVQAGVAAVNNAVSTPTNPAAPTASGSLPAAVSGWSITQTSSPNGNISYNLINPYGKLISSYGNDLKTATASLNAHAAAAPGPANNAPAPTTPTTPTSTDVSNITVNTGDPSVDGPANALLEKMWEVLQQTSGNKILQPLSDTDIKALQDKVDQVYGPSISKAKDLAESVYNQGLSYSQGQNALGKEQNATSTKRAQEDLSRVGSQYNQEQTRQLQVLGRNYQQATEDMQKGYQQNNRTFSGDRVKDETRLSDYNQQDIADVKRQIQDKQNELAIQAQRTAEDNALSNRQLDLAQQNQAFNLTNTRDASLNDLDAYRKQVLSDMVNQQTSVPFNFSSLLASQPSYLMPTTNNSTTVSSFTPITTPTRTLSYTAPSYSYPSLNSGVSVSSNGFVNNPAITAARAARGYSTSKTRF